MRKILWLHFFLQLWNNDRRTHAWVTHLSKSYFEIGQSHQIEESGEDIQCKPTEELHYSVIYLAQGTGQYLGQIYIRIICFFHEIIYQIPYTKFCFPDHSKNKTPRGIPLLCFLSLTFYAVLYPRNSLSCFVLFSFKFTLSLIVLKPPQFLPVHWLLLSSFWQMNTNSFTN